MLIVFLQLDGTLNETLHDNHTLVQLHMKYCAARGLDKLIYAHSNSWQVIQLHCCLISFKRTSLTLILLIGPACSCECTTSSIVPRRIPYSCAGPADS